MANGRAFEKLCEGIHFFQALQGRQRHCSRFGYTLRAHWNENAGAGTKQIQVNQEISLWGANRNLPGVRGIFFRDNRFLEREE